jgi:hypothetical protein
MGPEFEPAVQFQSSVTAIPMLGLIDAVLDLNLSQTFIQEDIRM